MSKFQYVCLIKRIWKQLVLSHIQMFPLNPLNEMAVEKFIKQFYAFQSQTFFPPQKHKRTKRIPVNHPFGSVLFSQIFYLLLEKNLCWRICLPIDSLRCCNRQSSSSSNRTNKINPQMRENRNDCVSHHP